jgi:Flp pilus assembly protein TadG
MRPRFRRLQRGSLTVFMVGAVFAMILAIGLGVDGSRALQGLLRASGEAQEAARAGADVLDVASVYGGSTPIVNGTGACGAAAAYIEQTGDDMVNCTPSVVDGAQLTVSVSAQVRTIFLGLFGVNSFTMKASATSEAIEGT